MVSRAEVLPTASVPPLTRVAPVYAFSPDKTSVPEPVLVSEPVPAMEPSKVSVCAVTTLTVALESKFTALPRVQLALLAKVAPSIPNTPVPRAELLFATSMPALTVVSPL